MRLTSLPAISRWGRDAAGVHYRSDSINGLFVGEEQALGLLCDYSRTYNERFDGVCVVYLSRREDQVVNGELNRIWFSFVFGRMASPAKLAEGEGAQSARCRRASSPQRDRYETNMIQAGELYLLSFSTARRLSACRISFASAT